ncbi:MAG: sugar phosphate nucleotidyltransferase, partial [Candidatus Hadarchaeota archaeon]|nr:sugar phosphate nucleotidyltransferase [Candidatus Hadarchaeota archaeon]
GVEPYILTNESFKDFFRGYKNVLVEKATKEEEKPGAVSAINNFIKSQGVDEDLLVLCSDNYFSEGFADFLKHYTNEPMLGVYCIGAIPELKPEEMGTLGFEGSDRYPPPEKSFYITEFKEKSPEPASEYVGTGMYIFPKSAFPTIDEYCKGGRRDEPGGIIEHFLKSGMKVKGYLFGGEWQDISHKSYLEALGEGRLVKSDERYVVVDRSVGNLVFSITILHSGKHTSGHSHPAGEVYFFAEGEGILEIDGKKRAVRSRDAVPIPPGKFHRVYNTSDKDLVFLCAFEKYEDRG